MKRDFLTKELGLEKEMTEKIMAHYGESVNSLKTENENIKRENDELKILLSEKDKKIAHIGELEGTNAELLKSVDKLTKELDITKLNGAISEKLTASGAKNLKAVSALIDKDRLTVEDGKISGLSEQIDKIKDECSYLFFDDMLSSGMRHTSSANPKDSFESFARAGAKLN